MNRHEDLKQMDAPQQRLEEAEKHSHVLEAIVREHEVHEEVVSRKWLKVFDAANKKLCEAFEEATEDNIKLQTVIDQFNDTVKIEAGKTRNEVRLEFNGKVKKAREEDWLRSENERPDKLEKELKKLNEKMVADEEKMQGNFNRMKGIAKKREEQRDEARVKVADLTYDAEQLVLVKTELATIRDECTGLKDELLSTSTELLALKSNKKTEVDIRKKDITKAITDAREKEKAADESESAVAAARADVDERIEFSMEVWQNGVKELKEKRGGG
ncbi:hypothetical protein B0J14DRAFT_632041 [Halenospora varia]|nr:hypothetical protein B0J14DRAFT_632041 [Halenospora varia]